MADVTGRQSADESEMVVTVRATESELAGLRRRVAEALRSANAAPDVVADFELAVSELATNVVQHTTSVQITVSLVRGADHWSLDVSDADALPDLADEISAPPAHALSGRGLFIVRTLMDHVDVVDIDGRRVIRCIKDDHAPSV